MSVVIYSWPEVLRTGMYVFGVITPLASVRTLS